MQTYITKYCSIKNNKLVNSEAYNFSGQDTDDYNTFIKSAFKDCGQKYMKFYKMDKLSKLAFVAAENLFMNNDFLNKYEKEDIGIIISNSYSSLETDNNYFETIKDKENYFPSPAIFVYTLPNILIGEICIKNKIKGEGTFFVSEEFNPVESVNYIKELFKNNDIQACISGWVDFIDDENYHALLYLTEKTGKNESLEFNEDNLNMIMQNSK